MQKATFSCLSKLLSANAGVKTAVAISEDQTM